MQLASYHEIPNSGKRSCTQYGSGHDTELGHSGGESVHRGCGGGSTQAEIQDLRLLYQATVHSAPPHGGLTSVCTYAWVLVLTHGTLEQLIFYWKFTLGRYILKSSNEQYRSKYCAAWPAMSSVWALSMAVAVGFPLYVYNNNTIAAESCQSYYMTMFLLTQTQVSQYTMFYVMLLTVRYYWYGIQDMFDGSLGRGNSAGGSGMRWYNKMPLVGTHQRQQSATVLPADAHDSKTVSHADLALA